MNKNFKHNDHVDSGLEALDVSRLVVPDRLAHISENEIEFWKELDQQAEEFFNSDPLETELHSLSSEEDVLYWNNVFRNLRESHNGPLLLYLQVRKDNTVEATRPTPGSEPAIPETEPNNPTQSETTAGVVLCEPPCSRFIRFWKDVWTWVGNFCASVSG